MTLLTELNPQALRVAELLRSRGEKIAVADGATGGLIAASLLTVPGALDFFVGGGVVYSFRARDVLFDLPREAYKGMRGASEDTRFSKPARSGTISAQNGALPRAARSADQTTRAVLLRGKASPRLSARKGSSTRI